MQILLDVNLLFSCISTTSVLYENLFISYYLKLFLNVFFSSDFICFIKHFRTYKFDIYEI